MVGEHMSLHTLVGVGTPVWAPVHGLNATSLAETAATIAKRRAALNNIFTLSSIQTN